MKKNSAQANSTETGIVYLPIEKIAPNPNLPRKHFDTLSLTELSESIAAFGVIQPITVRRSGGGYEIISGERRLRASYIAGLKEIPAIIIAADENKSAALALLENLQREDLSFFEIAESYKELLSKNGFSKDSLSKCMGKSPGSISEKLRLLHLPPIVKKFIRTYGLTENHARALLSIDNEKTLIDCVKFIHKNNLSPRQTENLTDELAANKNHRDCAIRLSSLKEVRLFTNTLRKSIDILNNSGINARFDKSEDAGGIKYIISINMV